LVGIVQAWKDDYVFLLQSCISVSSADVIDAWQMKLFGGDTASFFSFALFIAGSQQQEQ